MFKVRLTTLTKSDLMRERNLMRRPLPNDQWEYYTEIKLLETEAEAHGKAAPYMQQNLRVEIVAYDMKGDERVIQQLRDIQPQQVYEAIRSLSPPASQRVTPLSLIKTTFQKLGTAFQALIFFVIAVSPIAGPSGERWELALMVGLGAVAIFLFGRSMGRDEGRQEAMKSLGRS